MVIPWYRVLPRGEQQMRVGPSGRTAHPRRAALPSGRLVFALRAPRSKTPRGSPAIRAQGALALPGRLAMRSGFSDPAAATQRDAPRAMAGCFHVGPGTSDPSGGADGPLDHERGGAGNLFDLERRVGPDRAGPVGVGGGWSKSSGRSSRESRCRNAAGTGQDRPLL